MADAKVLGGTGTVKLDKNAFGAEFNGPLVHESVRAEQAARRQGTHSTKTRGEVRGGGAKPWRQKGTGRARAGSARAPPPRPRRAAAAPGRRPAPPPPPPRPRPPPPKGSTARSAARRCAARCR